MKDSEQYEVYEKARKHTNQKKRLYFHFILFLVGSVFFVILNKIIKYRPEHDWFVWAIFIWLFILIIHFINVFVMNRFFGKEWARIQTEKLIEKHQVKLGNLEKSLKENGTLNPHNSDEDLNS